MLEALPAFQGAILIIKIINLDSYILIIWSTERF